MKTITLEEFAEIAKKDEALKEKMIEIATRAGDTQIDDMIALAAEYGYELEKKLPMDFEAMSDDDLENVVAGSDSNYKEVCTFLLKLILISNPELYCPE